MKATVLATTAALLLYSAAASASQCATDLQEVDAALSTNPNNLSSELLEQATKARDEGAALCTNGNEAAAAESLSVAKFILGL